MVLAWRDDVAVTCTTYPSGNSEFQGTSSLERHNPPSLFVHLLSTGSAAVGVQRPLQDDGSIQSGSGEEKHVVHQMSSNAEMKMRAESLVEGEVTSNPCYPSFPLAGYLCVWVCAFLSHTATCRCAFNPTKRGKVGCRVSSSYFATHKRHSASVVSSCRKRKMQDISKE